MENKLIIPEGITTTNYNIITNSYIFDEYVTSDAGVKKVEYDSKGNKKTDMRICSAISIIDRLYDKYTGVEYLIFEYYNNLTEEVETLSFLKSEIGTRECIASFKNNGFKIYNNNSFLYFLESMEDAVDQIRFANKIANNNVADILVTKHASTQYGFPSLPDGTFDYTKFVTNEEISKDQTFVDIDTPLFQEKGTLEQWKANMEFLGTQFKDINLLKICLASTLSGIVKRLAGSWIAPAVLVIDGPSTLGKGFLAILMSMVTGAPSETGRGTTCSVDDSEANFGNTRSRLCVLNVIITDIQSKFDEEGNKWLSKFLYQHSDGTRGGRNTKENISKAKLLWFMTMVLFGEHDQCSGLTGGAAARAILWDTHLKNGEQIVKNEDCSEFYKYENEAYGVAIRPFINKIIELHTNNNNEIADSIRNYSNEINETINQKKQSNSIALLLYTYNLCVKFDIFPASWGEMTVEEITSIFAKEDKQQEPFERIYDVWSANVVKDPRVPEISAKISKEMYDEMILKKQAILGRKELVGNTMYIYMPEENLQAQFDYYAEKLCVKTSPVISKLKDYELLVKYPVNNRYQWKKTNITYVYQKGVKQEAIYCVKINMGTDTDAIDVSMGEKDKLQRDVLDLANQLKNELK